MQTVLVLRQLGMLLEQMMHGVTRRLGLRPQDALVLGWLVQKPGISGNEIAWFLGRSRQGVQRTLERLEGMKLIERYKGTFHNRTVGWGMTEQGCKYWAQLERGLGTQEASLRNHGVDLVPFLHGLKSLMSEVTKASRAMASVGLIELPPEEKAQDCDV